MRFYGQIRAAGLEDREDGSHPVQVPLGHHRDDPLATQSTREQGSCQPVRPGVELGIGPLPVAVHGRDGVRVGPHPLLEQLVHPPVRQVPVRSGETFELEAQFPAGQQRLPPVLGLGIRGDQLERGAVIAGDPGRAARVEHVGAVPQPQHDPAAVRPDPHPQHGVPGQLAIVADRIEHGLK